MKKTITRNIIIIVVVVALGAGGYILFFQNNQNASTNALQTTTNTGAISTDGSAATGTDNVGQDFLTQVLNIQSIKLDTALFSNKAFTVLQDFNLPIPPDTNPGRQNPFAPLGSDSTVVSTQVSTGNPSSVTATTSTLNGTLTVSDPSATRWFEYGTTKALGTLTAPTSQTTPGVFAEKITGLTPNTSYFVRASASIGGVTVTGNVVTWKTAQQGAN